MFKTVTPLDSNLHRDLKLAVNPGFGFAAGTMTMPLVVSELIEAAKFYPVVFSGEGAPTPHALLSLTEGVNEFVGADGVWQAAYIPAHARRYPFMLAATGEAGGYVVAIDPEAPHLQNGTQPAFDAEGKLSPMVAQVVQFLEAFQREIDAAPEILAPLAELVEPQMLEWVPPNGERQGVTGFRIINAEKLSKLPDAEFLKLRAAGLLPLIYAHLASLSNLARLTERATLRLSR